MTRAPISAIKTGYIFEHPAMAMKGWNEKLLPLALKDSHVTFSMVHFLLPAALWQSSQVTAAGKMTYFSSHNLQVAINLKHFRLSICKKK